MAKVKMDVFISWSGARSRAVAEALKKYLRMVINDLEPWLSSADIDKGSRSTEEIARALTNARAGIICLTPNNLNAPWILFEAGAIAKTVQQKPLACTLLIGLEVTALPASSPLIQFQATKPTQSDLLALLQTLNKALGDAALDPQQVKDTFELCWPKLKETLDHLPEDGTEKPPDRTSEDMLKEIVTLTRQMSVTVDGLRPKESIVWNVGVGNRLPEFAVAPSTPSLIDTRTGATFSPASAAVFGLPWTNPPQPEIPPLQPASLSEKAEQVRRIKEAKRGAEDALKK